MIAADSPDEIPVMVALTLNHSTPTLQIVYNWSDISVCAALAPLSSALLFLWRHIYLGALNSSVNMENEKKEDKNSFLRLNLKTWNKAFRAFYRIYNFLWFLFIFPIPPLSPRVKSDGNLCFKIPQPKQHWIQTKIQADQVFTCKILMLSQPNSTST